MNVIFPVYERSGVFSNTRHSIDYVIFVANDSDLRPFVAMCTMFQSPNTLKNA